MKTLEGVVMDCVTHPKGGWSAVVHFDNEVPVGTRLVQVEQAAPKAAPGEREQAAQRLRDLAGISQDDVTDPFHPRYIEGYKAGHAAGRKRAAQAAQGGNNHG